MVSVRIPAHLDASGKATTVSDLPPPATECNNPQAVSQRQRWMTWLASRVNPDKEHSLDSVSKAQRSSVRRQSTVRRPKQPLVEEEAEPEVSPLEQRRKTLMSCGPRVDTGEAFIFTQNRGTVRLTQYKSAAPGSELQAQLDLLKAMLEQESTDITAVSPQEDKSEAQAALQLQKSLKDREGDVHEYIFTACATGE